jgi:hypothetical protein
VLPHCNSVYLSICYAGGLDHEFVIQASAGFAVPDTRTGRLITPIGSADTRGIISSAIPYPKFTPTAFPPQSGCPAFARSRLKIPFFCPAAVTPQGLIVPFRGLANGEIAK